MGWWSADIMGGDSPLDVEDAFFEIANVEKFPESGGITDISKEEVEKNMKAFIAEVKRHAIKYMAKKSKYPLVYFINRNADYQPEIAWQVLAVTAIKVGAKISKPVMKKMIEACENDEWAKHDGEDSEHGSVCNSLKKALQQYDGSPIIIKSKGLFEVIEKHIEDGNSGLVNKNI